MNRLPKNESAKPRLSTRTTPIQKHNVLYVTKLKGDEREQFVLISPAGYCFLTHWTGTKTVPCWEDHSLCEGGHNEGTLRENWLFHGWSMTKNRETFVYLTPTAMKQVLNQAEPGANFRGRVLTLTRTRSAKGRLNAELSNELSRDPASLPPARNPYESVLNFLKVYEVPAGSPQPSPGPLPLDPDRNGHLVP